MYPRILMPYKGRSFFLFGPRGCGKTTWVRTTFPDSVYIDLLESEIFNDLLANPQRIERFIPVGYKKFIIIDEVQRIPEILNEVHRLIEEKYKFIMTGSSARKLKRKGTANLLAGRALIRYMYPLTAAELGSDFNLTRSMAYGLMPEAVSEKNPSAYLESYVKTYLEQEIRDEGLSRNLSSFARFLESASFSQGSVLNISAVASECGIERKTVENYFTVLEDLLIAYRIPVFSKRAKRRLVAHRKFYFFDTGVYRTLRPSGPLDLPEQIQGVALETLFFQELLAINSYRDMGYRIFFWRTSNNLEVDFVIYGKNGLFAFEVTTSSRYSEKMTSGLKHFLKDYPMTKAYLVYGGNRSFYAGNINVIPVNTAFAQLGNILASR